MLFCLAAQGWSKTHVPVCSWTQETRKGRTGIHKAFMRGYLLRITDSQPRTFANNQTVREALTTAMEEEMLRDETVFVMGEEVARYNGAYKVCLRRLVDLWLLTVQITKGLLDKFGEDRVIDVS